MIVCKLESGDIEVVRVFAQEHPAVNRRHAISASVGVGEEGAKAVKVSRLKTQLFARHATRRDSNREDDARVEELILVRKIPVPLLIDRQVETEEFCQSLLRASLE